MLDLVLRGCTLPDGRRDIDIGIESGRIVALQPALEAQAALTMDAGGQLVSPPFVMYYLTFLLPRARELLEREGFEVDVRRDILPHPFTRLVLVVATRH